MSVSWLSDSWRKNIPDKIHKVDYQVDRRPGAAASATARLVIVATLCVFQYWLLTATMEAFHAGNHKITLPTFLASLVCLALAVGLVLTGEKPTQLREDSRE